MAEWGWGVVEAGGGGREGDRWHKQSVLAALRVIGWVTLLSLTATSRE